MFESAELGHKIDKARYEKDLPKLRTALLDAQYALLERAEFPVLILLAGVDAGGRGETVNTLLTWLDPRHVRTRAFALDGEKNPTSPRLIRFFRDLPPRGHIGIMFGAWYAQPVMDRAYNRIDDDQLTRALSDIAGFERSLVQDGALILKFWMHLTKKDQKARLQALESDPLTRWRVSEEDWEHFRKYKKLMKHVEQTLRTTSTVEAPWSVIAGKDRRYRELSVGQIITQQIERRLSQTKVTSGPSGTIAPVLPALDQKNLLTELDMERSVPKARYETELEKLQGRLNELSREPAFRKKHAAICIFEGPDAAGKGGAIRRMTPALDARVYDVVPIAAPSDEERAHHYLWRFAKHLPSPGRFTIFDRSWYGRVLVERVEGLCQEAVWRRAYAEINALEAQLAARGVVVVKYWLAISKEVQLARFRERENTPFKHYKITKEDYRNRKKWDAYQHAASDMFDRTSTREAPWTLVPANDKYFARIHVLKTLVEAIERAL